MQQNNFNLSRYRLLNQTGIIYVDKKSNIFSASAEPEDIWQNMTPNSPLWCRPQQLIREEESRCVGYTIPYTDKCRRDLNEKPSVITSFQNPVSFLFRFLLKQIRFT